MTHPPANERRLLKTSWVGLVAAVFLAATLVPPALADSDRPGDASNRPDRDRPHKDRPDKDRRPDHAFSLQMNGTGVGRDNATYRIELSGAGELRAKHRDDNLTGFKGAALVTYRIYDADGALLKTGDGRLKIRAHVNDEGEWKWKASSFKVRHDRPIFGAHGTASLADGVLTLDGVGHFVFKKDGDRKATPVKLTDVSGTLTRLA